MLKLVSDNSSVISAIACRYNAFTTDEAKELMGDVPKTQLLQVNKDNKPYKETITTVSGDDRPILKQAEPGHDFTLAVHNIMAGDYGSFVCFEARPVDVDDTPYVMGSKRVLDPEKHKLTQNSIAVIPMLHIFNKQIGQEVRRTEKIIAKSRGNTVSLSVARGDKMMKAALNATHNVMIGLYGERDADDVCDDSAYGLHGMLKALNPYIDAPENFYHGLMEAMETLFDPAIRCIGEKIALGGDRPSSGLVWAP